MPGVFIPHQSREKSILVRNSLGKDSWTDNTTIGCERLEMLITGRNHSVVYFTIFIVLPLSQTCTLAGHLLNNTQASGFPRLRVSPGQSATERTLAEIVVHTTTVLSNAGLNPLLVPFKHLMNQPAAMNVIMNILNSFYNQSISIDNICWIYREHFYFM